MACIIHERLIGLDTTARLDITVDSGKSAGPRPAKSLQPVKTRNAENSLSSPVRAIRDQDEGALSSRNSSKTKSADAFVGVAITNHVTEAIKSNSIQTKTAYLILQQLQ